MPKPRLLQSPCRTCLADSEPAHSGCAIQISSPRPAPFSLNLPQVSAPGRDGVNHVKLPLTRQVYPSRQSGREPLHLL